MLVISRRRGDRFFLGDNICVTVVEVQRGKVRIGIEAPRSIGVRREETLPPLEVAAKRDRIRQLMGA
jgi:carbon storage regulator